MVLPVIERKFNGKTYRVWPNVAQGVKGFKGKRFAQDIAKDIRARGWKARVVETSERGIWRVYMRKEVSKPFKKKGRKLRRTAVRREDLVGMAGFRRFVRR